MSKMKTKRNASLKSVKKYHAKFWRKFLSMGLCTSLALNGMQILGGQKFVAEAADSITIPVEYFATPADLETLTNATNNGDGLTRTIWK